MEKGFVSKKTLTTNEQIDKPSNMKTKTYSRKRKCVQTEKATKGEKKSSFLHPIVSIKNNYKSKKKKATNQKK